MGMQVALEEGHGGGEAHFLPVPSRTLTKAAFAAQSCVVNMMDTVLLANGAPQAWLVCVEWPLAFPSL